MAVLDVLFGSSIRAIFSIIVSSLVVGFIVWLIVHFFTGGSTRDLRREWKFQRKEEKLEEKENKLILQGEAQTKEIRKTEDKIAGGIVSIYEKIKAWVAELNKDLAKLDANRNILKQSLPEQSKRQYLKAIVDGLKEIERELSHQKSALTDEKEYYDKLRTTVDEAKSDSKQIEELISKHAAAVKNERDPREAAAKGATLRKMYQLLKQKDGNYDFLLRDLDSLLNQNFTSPLEKISSLKGRLVPYAKQFTQIKTYAQLRDILLLGRILFVDSAQLFLQLERRHGRIKKLNDLFEDRLDLGLKISQKIATLEDSLKQIMAVEQLGNKTQKKLDQQLREAA